MTDNLAILHKSIFSNVPRDTAQHSLAAGNGQDISKWLKNEPAGLPEARHIPAPGAGT